VRVLVAPDSFKGTLSATEVAEAIARGVESAGLAADRCPLADGGEGTLDVLAPALGARRVTARAHDPLGRMIEAAWGWAPDRDATAVVETAAASGLALVAPDERDAWAASSYGTGELIAAAAAAGAHTILLAAGGSATTDGGAGALAALAAAGGAPGDGAGLDAAAAGSAPDGPAALDAAAGDAPAGPAALDAAALAAAAGALRGARLVVLCDVRTPFERAAETFAPQKGADPETTARLAQRLDALAARLPRDPRGRPLTGCAGGLSGGLWAALDAQLVPGAAYVLDALGVDRRLRQADAVITGEGRLDAQTAEGKLVAEVALRAAAAGIPAYALVGQDALEPAQRAALPLAAAIEAGTPAALEAAGARLAARIGATTDADAPLDRDAQA
jgi:glycerate 2-kinase